MQIGSVLCFLQSNNDIGALQVILLRLHGVAGKAIAGNAQSLQRLDGEWAHGANIVDTHFERYAT